MATSWKTLRIFISSTFRDMNAERDHLVRFVFPRLREALLSWRIHLIDVDLRWGVTSEQDSVAACREIIDECHPRFMGMLGGRYGWVPPEKDLSITEDEVHYGVLERDAATHGNAFFYIREEDATASIIEKQPGDFREPAGSENARKLAELKQSIASAGLPVFTYAARWDPDHERLTGIEAFGEHVYAYLLKNIQDDPELADRFAGAAASPTDEFDVERESMGAFIEDRTERYIVGSRQPLFDKLTAFSAADAEANIFVLEGEAGSGKSSVLGKFCQLLASQSNYVLVSHFVGASVGSADLRRMLRRLCHELARATGDRNTQPEDIRELIDRFAAQLRKIAEGQRVILVIDAINQLDAAAHGMGWLPLVLPPNVRIIVSSLVHPALDALRRRKAQVLTGKLEALSEADTRSIVSSFLQRYSKRFSVEQINALLAKPESRLPLYVLTALQELRTLGTYEEITERIRELPGHAKPLFVWILRNRLSNDPGFRDPKDQLCGAPLVTKFASYLGVSRHGLSQQELIDLLDPGDPLGNVAALLRLLRPYLMHRGELIDFFHNQLREAVEEEYLASTGNQLVTHKLLASYFRDVADPNRGRRWKGTSKHALSELPYHLIRAEEWPELVDALESIFFLEGKIRFGMTFELALDFRDAVMHLPDDHPRHRSLTLLETALRRDLHFIDQHAQDYPQVLFQCLWNSCWWYDSDEAAFHYPPPMGGWQLPPPWEDQRLDLKLSTLLERWRVERGADCPGVFWLRSVRPPVVPLGSGPLAVWRGHEGGVHSVAFSSDGLRVASGSQDGTVRVWDVATGGELAVMRHKGGQVLSVAFSPDGRAVASGHEDHSLVLWDADTGTKVAVLRGHDDHVACVAYSPDGSVLASGSGDTRDWYECAIRLWDPSSGRELAVLTGHEMPVTSVAFSPDGSRLVSGSADKTIRLWDPSDGRELNILRGHTGRGVTSVAFSPDGRQLLSGSYDGTMRLWDAENGDELAILSGHDSYIISVAFSPDGRRLLSGSLDMTARLWDAETRAQLSVLSGHEGRVYRVAFSPNGRQIITASQDATIRLWDPENSQVAPSPPDHGQTVSCMAFSPGGGTVLTGCGPPWAKAGRDYPLRLWDADNGRQLAVFRGHERTIRSVAFSPDGRRAVSGAQDDTARIWDIVDGREFAVLRGHKSYLNSVAFSPDGTLVVTGAGDKTVRLWNSETGRELSVLSGHTRDVSVVRFSPDGHRILSGDDSGEVHVWDTQSRVPLTMHNEDLEVLFNALSNSPHVLIARDETLIRSHHNLPPEARLPEALSEGRFSAKFQFQSSRRILAGSSANAESGHFLLLHLEGHGPANFDWRNSLKWFQLRQADASGWFDIRCPSCDWQEHVHWRQIYEPFDRPVECPQCGFNGDKGSRT